MLREVWRNKVVRYGTYVLGVFSAWDVCSNQFGWPKIPAVWGMTGALLPLWAWAFLFLALFVFGLFEYVRKGLGLNASAPPSAEFTSGSLQLLSEMERLSSLETQMTELRKYAEGVASEQASEIEKIHADVTKVVEQFHKDASRRFSLGRYIDLRIRAVGLDNKAARVCSLADDPNRRMEMITLYDEFVKAAVFCISAVDLWAHDTYTEIKALQGAGMPDDPRSVVRETLEKIRQTTLKFEQNALS